MLCNRRKCNCLKHTTGPHIGCPHQGVDSSGALWGHSWFQPAPIAPPQGMAGSSDEDHNTSEKTYLNGKILSGGVRKYKEQPSRHKRQWIRNRRLCSILAPRQRAIWAQISLKPVKGPMPTVIFFPEGLQPMGSTHAAAGHERERAWESETATYRPYLHTHLPCIAQEMGGEESGMKKWYWTWENGDKSCCFNISLCFWLPKSILIGN